MAETTSKVAKFIALAKHKSGKTNQEIANEAGFDKPNIISMFANGVTKLPLDRVPLMAAALSIDPLTLMRMCMEEYNPTTYETLQSLQMFTGVSKNEARILIELRKISENSDPAFGKDNADHLRDFVKHASV